MTPAMEDMLMTLPRFRSSIARPNALQQLKMPRTFTAYRRSQSAAVVLLSVPTWPMPATLARTSSVPVRAAAEAQAASFDTSSGRNSPPIFAATLGPFVSSQSATHTFAPACAKISAMAAPMPEAPPVTSAVLFSRLNIGQQNASAANQVKPRGDARFFAERHRPVTIERAARVHAHRQRTDLAITAPAAREEIADRHFDRRFGFAVPVETQDRMPPVARGRHPDLLE